MLAKGIFRLFWNLPLGLYLSRAICKAGSASRGSGFFYVRGYFVDLGGAGRLVKVAAVASRQYQREILSLSTPQFVYFPLSVCRF